MKIPVDPAVVLAISRHAPVTLASPDAGFLESGNATRQAATYYAVKRAPKDPTDPYYERSHAPSLSGIFWRRTRRQSVE